MPSALWRARAAAPHREFLVLLLEDGLDASKMRDKLHVRQRLGCLPLDPALRQHLPAAGVSAASINAIRMDEEEICWQTIHGANRADASNRTCWTTNLFDDVVNGAGRISGAFGYPGERLYQQQPKQTYERSHLNARAFFIGAAAASRSLIICCSTAFWHMTTGYLLLCTNTTTLVVGDPRRGI
jgi:hypothetical protein